RCAAHIFGRRCLMAKTKDDEVKTSGQAAPAESEKKTKKKAAGDADTTRRAKTSRAKSADAEKESETAARRQPAAPAARPSIYDAITATANKAEAERAAKAAARKAAATQQSTVAKPAVPAAQTPKPKASPFLNTPITRAVRPVT